MSKNDFMSIREYYSDKFASKQKLNTIYGVMCPEYKSGESPSEIIFDLEQSINKYVGAYRDFVLMVLYEMAEIEKVKVKENDRYIRTDYVVKLNGHISTFTHDDFLYREVRYIYHVRLWEKNNECEVKNEDE